MPDAALRLRLYRRMALLDSMPDIDEMAEELADRFGPIPDPTYNLLFQLRIKLLAQRGGVTAVTTENGQVKIRLSGLEYLNRFHLQRYLGESARVSKTGRMDEPDHEHARMANRPGTGAGKAASV